MPTTKLRSRAMPVGEMPTFTDDEIKVEPMYFNAEEIWVKLEAEPGPGPITRAFFHALPDSWKPTASVPASGKVFDSRVHMLMDGWYPAIPGFHLDDIPRGEDGQPNVGEGDSLHVLAFVGKTPTLFVEGDLEFEYEVGDENVYKQLDLAVESWLDSGDAEVIEAKPGVLYLIDSQTVHACQANYEGFGWRWFGRLSWNTPRSDRVTNEIRRQVQAYVNVREGW